MPAGMQTRLGRQPESLGGPALGLRALWAPADADLMWMAVEHGFKQVFHGRMHLHLSGSQSFRTTPQNQQPPAPLVCTGDVR